MQRTEDVIATAMFQSQRINLTDALSGSQVGKSEGLRQIAMEVSLLLTRRFISLILRFISLRTLANT